MPATCWKGVHGGYNDGRSLEGRWQQIAGAAVAYGYGGGSGGLLACERVQVVRPPVEQHNSVMR